MHHWDNRDLGPVPSVVQTVYTERRYSKQTRNDEMAIQKIAVPAISEQGLDSPISAHFGHSPMFVISTVEDGKVVEVETLRNAGHSSCAEPVMALADRGVKTLIVLGMGGRPYMVTQQVGMSVIKAEGGTVGEVLKNYLEGISSDMGTDALCGGGESKPGCSGESKNH